TRTDKQAPPAGTDREAVTLARRPLLLGGAVGMAGLGAGLGPGRPVRAQTPAASWGKGPLSGLPWHSGAA
ncbi:hypothetical protein, partial [Mycobacterium tuberculosis]|uniref:hypothetical protein n=1 Tax=Mycobacterium tuberculosis TaxID=1773 RepID=UPI001BE45422